MGNEKVTAEQTPTPGAYYRSGLRRLEVMEVIKQPKEIVRMYRVAAYKMDKAGKFRDAPQLAEKYRAEADRLEKEMWEAQYRDACEKMKQAQTTAQRNLAVQMFEEIEEYKDAKALIAECQNKNSQEAKRKNTRILAGVCALVLIAAAFILYVLSPQRRYREAERLLAKGSYQEANVIYKKLEDYKDSKEKSALCVQQADLEKRSVGMAQLETVKIGKTLAFGPYEWKVIDRTDDAVLLLGIHSDQFSQTSHVPYHTEKEAVTWETSTVRAWLNSAYLDDFTVEERARILLTDVVNEDNPTYGTKGGPDTEDYVFLMSIAEAKKYEKQIASMGLNWFLRSPGNEETAVAYMNADHIRMEYGYPATTEQFYIRPMMWVSAK